MTKCANLAHSNPGEPRLRDDRPGVTVGEPEVVPAYADQGRAETPQNEGEVAKRSSQTIASLAAAIAADGLVPWGPVQGPRTRLEHLTHELAVACLAAPDPNRAIAGCVGRLLQLQADIGRRGRTEEESGEAPRPHRSRRKARVA